MIRLPLLLSSLLALSSACTDGKITLDDTGEPSTDDSRSDDSRSDDSRSDDSRSDDSADPVDADGDGVDAGVDCNDGDATVYPGADELCDGLDNDCDGLLDNSPVEGEAAWSDNDRDGYGAGDPTLYCQIPPDVALQGGDCDDNDPAVNPDAEEVCDPDNQDEDCDGQADDADPSTAPEGQSTWYTDRDGDGAGDPDTATQACDAPSGAVATGEDCDDSDATRSDPGDCSWDGTYSGTMTLTATVAYLGSDTCSGSGAATVVEGASTEISGSLKCTFAGTLSALGAQSGAFDGELTGADTAEGDISVGSYFTDTWTGSFTGTGTLSGSFSGTTTVSGFAVTYTGSFSLQR